jgi:hypothetical protein
MKQAITKYKGSKVYKTALKLPKSQSPKKTPGMKKREREREREREMLEAEQHQLKSYETTWTRF